MSIIKTQSPFRFGDHIGTLGTLNWLAWATVVIGALNWGAVGLFDINLVAGIFEAQPLLARAVYALVGAAGMYLLSIPFQGLFKDAG
ncbi:DUF378 domain-containing protein [Pseudacidovorax sp. RU35E]|jgi:uncharacterized membrane protein YuzA (DUF378 family)|uniref:DUF378 domain-containing protein n=1 Tax=Pseudacidovorax sp. RU35E TaxID=1907403 RepID=UPI000956CB37|nr:DUF378 domain-containing protein [Pseudacidovorax sp. RU35E]SIR70830.1 Uncharacterized membrane protein YuzA, DUF378 family [Pseudacidovorax sp. RU35E]